MAVNDVQLRVGSVDNTGVDFEKLKARLADIGRQVASVAVDVNDKAANLALDRVEAKFQQLNRTVSNPRLSVTGAARAQAALTALDLQIDELNRKQINIRSGGFLGTLKSMLGMQLEQGVADSVEKGGASGASQLPGILGTAVENPELTAAVAGVFAAATPFIAQAVGGALVTGFGAAIAGMAVYGAMQTKKVQKSFDDLKQHAQQDLVDIGKPFQPVMQSIFATASNVLGQMTPLFKNAAGVIAGPFESFADTLISAFGQSAVKTSIQAVATAFGDILDAVKPQLAGDVQEIASGITRLAQAISANPQAFATFGRFITNLVAWALDIITGLTKVANYVETHWYSMWADAGSFFAGFATTFLKNVRSMSDVFLTVVGTIVDGAARAFGWVPGVGGKLKSAASQFDTFRQGVTDSLNRAIGSVQSWKANVDNMPKIVRLQGSIQDLQSKLSTAETELKNPDLTKTRKTQIQASITQLEAQIRKAKAELDALNGKTAYTYVVAVGSTGHTNQALAAGGVVGAAGGGARSAMVMVGEHGRELVSLPSGSTVHSNPDSERMMSAGPSGPGSLQLEVVTGGGSQFEQFMARFIRQFVRVKGGGDVQRAFGVT